MTKPPTKNNKPIPPSCRRAGVLTAGELLAEESMLMDFETTKTTKGTPINETQQDKTQSTPTSEEDEEGITPYQQPPKDPSPSGASVVSEELPNRVWGSLWLLAVPLLFSF